MTPLAEPQEQPARRMTAHEERRAKLIHLRPQRGVVLALREPQPDHGGKNAVLPQ